MTTSKTDLEGSIQEHDEQIDKKVTQEGRDSRRPEHQRLRT